MNCWRIHVSGVEEVRESTNPNAKYLGFIIEIQQLDINSSKYLIHCYINLNNNVRSFR